MHYIFLSNDENISIAFKFIFVHQVFYLNTANKIPNAINCICMYHFYLPFATNVVVFFISSDKCYLYATAKQNH